MTITFPIPSNGNADVRSNILCAATGQFIAHGYRDASIDRIVAAARISKTTFYAYFRNKREVLEAALDQVEIRLGDLIPPPSPSKDVRETLIRYSGWIRKAASSAEYSGLYRVSVELAQAEPAFARALHRRIRDRRGPFLQYLEQLAGRGMLTRSDSSVLNGQFGFLLIGGLATIMSGSVLPAREEARWARSVAALFMNGYRRDGDQDSPSLLPAGSAAPLALELEDAEQLYARRRGMGMRLTKQEFDTLLAVGAETFLEKGYRDTALPDIAARTGISRMTLRRQFGGKAEFFVACIGHYAHQLYFRSDPLPMHGDIDTALPSIATYLHARFRRDDNIRLLRLMVAQSTAFPALAAAVYVLSRHNDLVALNSAFAGWIDRGELGKAYADVAAQHFHTLAINGNAALFRDQVEEADASPQGVCALFLDGCIRDGAS